MNQLVEYLNEHTPLATPLARLTIVVCLVALAAVLVRLAARLARWLVDHSERHWHSAEGLQRQVKERETAISLAQTSIRYAIWALAALLSLSVAFGARGVETVAGASFLAIVVGFAIQRFLMDLIAGGVMFFEGWFRVGDTVRVAPWGIDGVVEEMSLRATVVRGAGGELHRVHNSQVLAVTLYPRGYREAELELVVRDGERGRAVVEAVSALVPVEPTRFVRAPRLTGSDELPGGLVSLRLRTAVAPGREWLAQELLPALLREQAGEELLAHGPVVTFVDELASRRFARLSRFGDAAATR
jgi:small conductance mechanosensitive channel